MALMCLAWKGGNGPGIREFSARARVDRQGLLLDLGDDATDLTLRRMRHGAAPVIVSAIERI